MDILDVYTRNITGSEDLHSFSRVNQCNESSRDSPPKFTLVKSAISERWAIELTLVLALAGFLIVKYSFATSTSRDSSQDRAKGLPPTASYSIPIIGHLVSFLYDTAELASAITKEFGSSAIVRLSCLHKDIYVVSGAEYLGALYKDSKGFTQVDGIHIALSRMFASSKQDMKYWHSDNSGITIDPHPQSSVKPENRGHYTMYKAISHGLTSCNLRIAGENFQAALQRRIDAVPVHDEWIEMDDLYSFLLPLISESTFTAMFGSRFLEIFPDFAEKFWTFHRKMRKLAVGWPHWMMPKAWEARDYCLSALKQWRRIHEKEDSEVNALYQERWEFFSKTQGLSDDGAASSDLGITWSMIPSTVASTFWLSWHMLRDRDLLTRVTSEVQTSRTTIDATSPPGFDMTKLCNQPLLQSTFAETLRLYVSVCVTRRPDFADGQILDYRIPKDKLIVISTAFAHMDKRNWNLGPMEEHHVESFWAERFLTYNSPSAGQTSPASSSAVSTSSITTSPDGAMSDPPEPKFSLNGYANSWIPFGGGIHECPGRHWVKLRMLLTFAMISSTFEIELLAPHETVKPDMAKYGFGALPPMEKAAFRIRRRMENGKRGAR